MYRLTVRCIHHRLICIIRQRDAISWTLNFCNQQNGYLCIIQLRNIIAFTQNRTGSLGLPPLYIYTYLSSNILLFLWSLKLDSINLQLPHCLHRILGPTRLHDLLTVFPTQNIGIYSFTWPPNHVSFTKYWDLLVYLTS